MTLSLERKWIAVCPIGSVPIGGGVAALLDGDVQVAVFRTPGGELFGLSNIDPFSGAAVLSRGIVGDSGGIPVVASPVYKQQFDLRTGACVEEPAVSVETFGIRVVDGVVQVSSP